MLTKGVLAVEVQLQVVCMQYTAVGASAEGAEDLEISRGCTAFC